MVAGLALSLAALSGCSGQWNIQRELDRGTGVVALPDGVVEVRAPLRVPPGAKDLEITGSENTVLQAGREFAGPAVLIVEKASRIRLSNFAINGNRLELGTAPEIPAAATPFARHFQNNGLLIAESEDVVVTGVRFHEIPAMAALVTVSNKVKIEKALVEDSGSNNAKGRNNTTGGILFEEGTEDFEVRDSVFRRVLGNAVWTHSTYKSRRNRNGRIEGNEFDTIGRDAVQVGHANRVRVINNRGRMIGYPVTAVDIDGGGIPVGIDTAGNVDESVYSGNRFEEINGKCIDLDGFHNGEVSGNVCINRGKAEDYPQGHWGLVMNNTNPDMESRAIVVRDNVFDGTKFGGIFVIGRGHRIVNNRLLRLNRAGCNESAARYGCSHFPGEPDLMQAGIYLGLRAERLSAARDNVVEHNEISGHRMKQRCVMSAPPVRPDENTVRNNVCTDQE
jgi:hypothetical protein